MHKQKSLSPLKLIESKPYRKSRSETLLRALVSSSYPHAIVSNITIAAGRGFGMTSKDGLQATARELREQERSIGLVDFIRCIEIIRDDTTLTIDSKRMRNLDELRQITDNAKSHESFLSSTLQHGGVAMEYRYAQQIAESLLSAYYRARVNGADKQRDLETLSWNTRTKELVIDPTGNSSLNSIKDLSIRNVDREVTYTEVVSLLTDTLVSDKPYRVMLTQNAIILKDQNIRITARTK